MGGGGGDAGGGGGDAGVPDSGTPDSGASDAGDDFHPDGSYNYVFVSSVQVIPASLHGADAGDEICQALAADAGLPGTFRAWIGLSGDNAVTRARLDRARGWIRPDRAPVVDRPEDFGVYVYYPPRLDERGRDVGSDNVVSGARFDGTVAPNCGDWTDAANSMEEACGACSAPDWLGGGGAPCGMPARLLCFGNEQYRALELAPVTGPPRVFTSEPWTTDGGGLAAADDWCNAQAAARDAGSGYVALLATTSASAASRLGAGTMWVRLDGVPVGDLHTIALLAPLAGGPAGLGDAAFTGAARVDTAGSSASTCADWTATTGVNNILGSWDDSSYLWFNNALAYPCRGESVYCAQP